MVRKITLFLARSIKTHLSRVERDNETSPGYVRAMELYGDLIIDATCPYQDGLHGLASTKRDSRIADFFTEQAIPLSIIFDASHRVEAHVMYLDKRQTQGVRLELRVYPKGAKSPWAFYVFTFADTAHGGCLSMEQSVKEDEIVKAG
jgi:hypothetical protein